ncbi:hypothetical protein KOI35_41460 [Actinoplanes bogorensis]|uniref:Secreted protein n=1 Tax=Paractinoplanes bogorensis TaxID=1610840 RepID=A0ABS5Z4W5_9ACTN|nr:hypothetical protein [Actinoplanes bogorensis]MBU2669994.1 hypothetical protein [Actinoplanes bogorensis]
MAELGVGRLSRAAFPLPSVSPAGDSTPLPPHIQGAERRSGNRARHTTSRWGLRVLVIGGLAGAAWLLTGAAAHAADRADGPDGSLLGSVLGADVTSPVTGLLQTAVQPLENSRPAHHEHQTHELRAVTDILDVPGRVLTRPAAVDRVTHGSSRTTVDAFTGVDEILGEVAAPLRLDGEPAPDQRLDNAELPEPSGDTRPVDDERPPVAESPQIAEETAEEPSEQPAEPSTTIDRVRPTPVVGHPAAVPVRHGKVTSASSAHRHHRTAHAVNAVPETAQEDSTPGGDGPAAPLRLHLGDVSGTPTSGSGTPTEGGSAAFLPAAIANSTMARHRPAIVSDVEVRRYDAEAPTVSPD